jgi:hypothetical protein
MRAVAKVWPEPGIDLLDLPLTPGYEFLTKHFPAVLGHEFSGKVLLRPAE